eukprot:CFRG2881T1
MPVVHSRAPREFYGGAISCELPVTLFDVSTIREIPDTQEVWAHKSADQSVIVDLLEFQSPSFEMAATEHFQQIAESNDALEHKIEFVHPLGAEFLTNMDSTEAFHIVGTQKVAKFKEDADAANILRIELVLIRLPHVTTDIVISFNNPVQMSTHSSSTVGKEPAHDMMSSQDFLSCVKTFNVVDFGLFGA